jgi:hypothetical protein
VRLADVDLRAAAIPQDIDRRDGRHGETAMDFLSILGYLAGIGALICHILIIVKMFQAGQTGLGIACIILFFCCGIGFLISLIYGWMRAKEWNISPLMTVYTALLVADLAIGGVRYNDIKEQIQKQLQKQGG